MLGPRGRRSVLNFAAEHSRELCLDEEDQKEIEAQSGNARSFLDENFVRAFNMMQNKDGLKIAVFQLLSPLRCVENKFSLRNECFSNDLTEQRKFGVVFSSEVFQEKEV
jgi:hypothetical protein